MKIAVFTRTAFHHTYFINRLQERFDLACVVREAYPDADRTLTALSVLGELFTAGGVGRLRDRLFLRKFHEQYSAGFRYHRLLKDYLEYPFDAVMEKKGTRYIHLNCGDINGDEFASFLRDLKPDIVAVLGSSIIQPHVIRIPSAAMINLHSGLSPYYRGTWSYGWPLVNGEPEYIGVTVHHVSPEIDAGAIIHQTRPQLEETDDLNTIFLKVIFEGVELVADAIDELRVKGGLRSYEQPEGVGRVYLTKDFRAADGRTCLANLEGGILSRYLARKEEADARVTLYGYRPPRMTE
jgi:methionyl-tRNA formyltransferase